MTSILFLVALAICSSALVVSAQTGTIGTVMRVTGSASVERRGTSAPLPLRFRDPIVLRDRITTGDASMLQVLLGGTAVLTMGEHSTLTLDETTAVAMIDVSQGRIKLAVMTARMKPGERLDVRTPNAIAVIRGTTLITEVSLSTACPSDLRALSSRFTSLTGQVDVAPRDPATGRVTGQFIALRPGATITISPCAAPWEPRDLAETEIGDLDASLRFPASASPPPKPLPRLHP